MAYDRQISTTYEQAITDLVDKVGGMTSWSIINDQRATGHVALEGPHTGEYLIVMSNMMGDGSDASYHFTFGGRNDAMYDYGAGQFTPFIADMNENMSGLAASDNVEYWLQYSDQHGFVFYLRRTMGDGNDWSGWLGILDYANAGGVEEWDPRLSDEWQNNGSPERFYHYAAWASSGTGNANWGLSDLPNTFIDVMCRGNDAPSGSPRLLSRPQGMLNPDTAFSDYVWWSRILGRDESIVNTDTGIHPRWCKVTDPLWLEDLSGTDLNTGDVIQDSGGADEWEIVDYHDNRVAIRMI